MEWTDEKYKKFVKEGRGQGEGKDYKPWLTIQDVPSRGRASRVYSTKTARIHHFFTDIETRYFYFLEWEDNVIDIREHYPLLDLDQILSKKNDIKWGLFEDKNSGTPHVLTSTFLITIKKGQEIEYVSRSIKASYALDKKRVIESMEIQRRYWKEKGVHWGIVTQKEIPIIKAQNLEWLRSSNAENRDISSEKRDNLSDLLLLKIQNEKETPIRDLASEFEKDLQLEAGLGLYIYKYLISSKRLVINFNNKIDLTLPYIFN